MPIEKILVLEDDPIARKNLEADLRRRRYEVVSSETLAEAEEKLARDSFDLMIVDVQLPDGDGSSLLTTLQHRPSRPLLVMMSNFGNIQSAVECMRNGAIDYLAKPYKAEQLDFTLKKAEQFNQLVKVNQFFNHDEGDDGGGELLGRSPAMEQLRQLVRKVAPTQATVLIQGESGTGKELVARALYRQSPRTSAAFIRINCAAVPENLIESEFFGHEKGAFTGALTKREGRFELAHGGTILLDEVSEVSPSIQAKLLRVLQERELERVGGNRTIRVDVRVIATTNRNLEQSIEKKEFRQDLYFRLNVVPIKVPPLRDRLEDVPFLAEQFMQRASRKHGIKARGFTDESLAILRRHSWPGNVRELQNVIERAVILCTDGGLIESEHLGLSSSLPVIPVPGSENGAGQSAGVFGVERTGSFPTLADVEREHIFAAMKESQGNRTLAAKMLDISIRTLRNKLNDYSGRTGAVADVEVEESAEV